MHLPTGTQPNKHRLAATLSTAERCRRALHQALVSYSANARFDSQGYVLDPQENLVSGVDIEDIRADFEAGAGHELAEKMRAPHSSSALVANTFGKWRRDPSSLSLAGETAFKLLRFEKACPVGLVRPNSRFITDPHLDVLAISSDAVVAIESKCLESFSIKMPNFSDSYDTIQDARAESPYFKLVEQSKEKSCGYRRLNVAQLVKHYLGLRACYPEKRITLVYAYWEPRNANDFAEFVEHRSELERFCDSVRSDSTVAFRAVCYRDLWDEWQSAKNPEWLTKHVHVLRQRYDSSA
jgi:hypothetical protein